MQNNFRPAFALSPYFVDRRLSRYLEPDEELLWEAHHTNYPRAFKITLLIEAGITAAILLFLTDMVRLLFLGLWLVCAVLIALLVYKLCYLIPTHYILTQKRFLILYFPQGSMEDPDKRIVLNVDFAQVQKITCSESSISFGSITMNIPSVSPARDLVWLYEELLARWEAAQKTLTSQEKARLEHLSRPPMNRYILYICVRSFFFVGLFVLILLPYILKLPEWVKIWTLLAFVIVQILSNNMTHTGRSYFVSLFVGKEYREARTFAPEYNQISSRGYLIIAVIGALLGTLYYVVR